MNDFASELAQQKAARQHFDERLAGLASERVTWESKWVDILEHLFPHLARFLAGETEGGKGDISYSKIFDGSPALACETFGEGMCAVMTNPAQKWMVVEHELPMLSERPDIEQWQEECGDLMLKAMNRGNIYECLNQSYKEFGAIGNAAALLDEHPKYFIHGHNFAPGEYYLGVDRYGRVDTCYRKFKLTVAQMVQQFGLKAVSQTIRDAWKGNRRRDEFVIVHAIEPVSADPMKGVDDRVPVGATWRSVYYERGAKGGELAERDVGLLDVSGYFEFPVMTMRLDVPSTSVYGVGRGNVALGDIKALMWWTNKLERAAEMEVDPPTLEPVGSTTKLAPLSTAPGARNKYNENATGKPTAGRLFESKFDPEQARARIYELTERIDKTFYRDAFQKFSDMKTSADLRLPQIAEISAEKLLRMASTTQRVIPGLNVLIDRLFGSMARAGQLPEAPEDIVGDELNIVYQSMIAKAQRESGVANIERFSGFVGNLAQTLGTMEPVDKFNSDQAIERYADHLGVSPKIVRSDEETAEIRQARLAAQAAPAAAQVAKDASGAAKTLSETPTEGDNYLNAMAGAVNQYAGV